MISHARKSLIQLICLLFFIPSFANAEETLRFGVYPHLPSRDLERVYSPIAEAFSSALKKPVSFESSSSFENFNDRLDQDSFDIVFVQPFDYIRIADAYGYRPLAMRGEELYTVFAVKADSQIKTIQDLKGKKLSLPASIAAVSRLAKHHLIENGISPSKDVTIRNRRSHMSCLQQVIINQAHACATADPVLRFFEGKMKLKLRTVGKSMSIPHTLFAVHPRMSKAQQEILTKTILDWPNNKEGKKILARGKLKPFQAIKDADYDVVRNLKAK